MNKYDLVTNLVALGVLGLGITCIYGAFWWVNTYVSPFYGLTLMEAIQMPVLDIVFAVMSFWVIPGFVVTGIGIILGLVKAVLE